jgi:uncharacterized protein (DUF362 family)
MVDVAIARDEDIAAAIHVALAPLPLDEMVRGKAVGVKPNDTWAAPGELTAVTQADTLRAVLREVKPFSPQTLVVTDGSGAAETEDVFRIAGLMDVIEQEGAAFFDHNRAPFEEVALDYSPSRDVQGPQRSVMVNPRVLEFETLIAVNQLKVHRTATVTLALKNIAMSFPAADYYGHPRSDQKHEHSFFVDMHSFIAAMARRFPIHLAVTVGHPAMIGLGPLHGHAVETGLVIASADAVAADVVGAKLLGFDCQAVRHLWEAGRMGLGETELRNMRFPVLSFEQAWQAFTEAAYGEKLELKQG